MDIKSPEERSRNMAKIRNTRTKPEMFIRSLLHRQGLRYRVNYSKCPGKPDLYFPARKIAVFVHGCYWHRHPGCKFAYTPKSNLEFWLPKLEGNRKHDELITQKLHDQGIRVLIIWECTVKQMTKDKDICKTVLNTVLDFIRNGKNMKMEL
ncbi:MAG: DNA mismatch endonuclease Vsr [Ruminococcaceae bacterium]|jgi:DNA mismatch endonuclease (patch repair protein)|nr:DNA mismatch endonuclease Vsr [Oscillospiraceae bacterium]